MIVNKILCPCLGLVFLIFFNVLTLLVGDRTAWKACILVLLIMQRFPSRTGDGRRQKANCLTSIRLVMVVVLVVMLLLVLF